MKEKILKLAKNNNGSISYMAVVNHGIHSEYLHLLVQEGKIERLSRGQYVLKNHLVDEMHSIQKQFQRGIYSHDSALFLLGFTDRTPLEFTMTFPRKYNITAVGKKGIKTYRVDEKYYSLGITSITDQFNNLLQVYSIERTLCDLLRPNSKISIEQVIDAFKQYSKTKSKKITNLIKYAKTFNVEETVRNYLEVLL